MWEPTPPPAVSQSFLCPWVGPKSRQQTPPHGQLGSTQARSPLRPSSAPPRLQLVAGPRGLRCAGVVEFYHGSLGGAIGYQEQDQDGTQDLKNLICAALQCGSFLKHLPGAETTGTQDLAGSKPLPIRWKIQNASCTSLEQCFRKVPPYEGGQALALVCSGE